MPTLELVSHHLCPYVQRAAIALREKGVPFRRTYVDLASQAGDPAPGQRASEGLRQRVGKQGLSSVPARRDPFRVGFRYRSRDSRLVPGRQLGGK